MSEEIKKIAKEFELTKDDFYKHQQSGKWILLYPAIEKIASKKGILLESIQVLNSEQSFCRLLVTMTMGDLRVTSIGEADSVNCKGNKYFGCMAEKRGIGRVVLKIINASQYGIASEEDFSNQIDKSFDEPKPSLPTHSKKPSNSKGEESVKSPLTSSPAWREGDDESFRNEEFSELKIKIKNISRDDLIKYFKKPEQLILDTDKELVAKEVAYRTVQKERVK